MPNTPAIMALQAISNIDVVLGAEKKLSDPKRFSFSPTNLLKDHLNWDFIARLAE